MKLVSMKIDPAQQREKYAESVAPEAPRYPYGLCLRLEDDDVEKLGLDKLPAVGKTVTVQAKAMVESVSENQYTEGGEARTRRSVSLQITDLAISGGGNGDAGDKLYKGD
jgi:hypothetical protein